MCENRPGLQRDRSVPLRFDGEIQAIKAVRELAAKTRIELNANGRNEIVIGADLRDTKDLVEAIMALGRREFANQMEELIVSVNSAVKSAK
jgi:hypothetical protein